ncbi:hypothetical protein KEM56_007412 [Ascosphaera pollenicola]|nr:hypothetical protein KEM56_007412 [Ascosphaera pollenicola]
MFPPNRPRTRSSRVPDPDKDKENEAMVDDEKRTGQRRAPRKRKPLGVRRPGRKSTKKAVQADSPISTDWSNGETTSEKTPAHIHAYSTLTPPSESAIAHAFYAHQLSSDSSLSSALSLPDPELEDVPTAEPAAPLSLPLAKRSVPTAEPTAPLSLPLPKRSVPTTEEPERPRPQTSRPPPAWAETRSELCESIAWFRSAQSGLYNHDGFAYGLLIDRDSGGRSYMDDEIIITRIGGGCSFKNGRLLQTKNHDAATRALGPVQRSMDYKIPVGVVLGQRNTICPSEVPHRYNVADFFRVTDIWFEKIDGKAAGRMRYEKCNLDEKSWWAPLEAPDSVPLSERDSPTQADLEQICEHCETSSLKIFTIGWMCLNFRCKQFFTIEGVDAERLELTYDPQFLKMRTRFTNAPKPLYSLVPDTLGSLTAAKTDTATARICWKGIHFPGVNPIPLRLVIPDLEMGAAGHSVPLQLNKGEIHPHIEYMKNYRKDTFEIENVGTITHFASNTTINARENGPNDMFQQLQEADIGLARHPLVMSVVPQMLTSHFAVNFGMPYKYVVNVDKKGFDEAPRVITNALGRLRWAAQQIAGDGAQLPNELLAVGYFEKMAMGYHDDGESSLGPTIATLSLGSKAEMTIRMKKKYWKPVQRGQFDPRKEVIMPGCGQYERRAKLREQFDAGELSPEQYETQRQRILNTIKGHECPVLVRMEVNHGDMIVMHGSNLQMYYEHAVEPKGDIRFALTGRYIRPDKVPQEALEQDKYRLPDAVEYDGDED